MARDRLRYLTPKEKLALQEYLQKLQQHYGSDVLSVKLHGSKVRGDHHEDSDLDLLVRVRQDDRQAYATMYSIKARNWREEADYSSTVTFTEQDAAAILTEAEEFVDRIERYLNDMGAIAS